jgi:putative transposase
MFLSVNPREPVILTHRYRIKGNPGRSHAPQARQVNRVWNDLRRNPGSRAPAQQKWPTGFDLINLTADASRDLALRSDTVQTVCTDFAWRRNQIRRRPRWRGNKALGWIPVSGGTRH